MNTTIVEEQEDYTKRKPVRTRTDQRKAVSIAKSANFSVMREALAGSRVRFGVSKVFRNIQEIKVQVLSDSDNPAPRSRRTKET
jgi:hypothetical protein